MRLIRLFCLLACAVGVGPGFAAPTPAAPLHRFAPAPAWVLPAPVEYDAPEPVGKLADGTWQLLYDRQINVMAAGDEFYLRGVQKIVNQAGVAAAGQVDLYVDPSYQALTIHGIQVLRQGKTIDAAPAARFTELPVENELDRLVYRGLYKVNIVLADVRVGDVVDFSYTLRSQERFFPGQYATRLQLEWGSPLYWQRLRVRYPSTRPMQIRFNRPDLAVEPVTAGGFTEFSYVSKNPKTVLDEEARPAWHEPWAIVELSDFAQWRTVASGFSGLFKPGARPRPRLDALVAELGKGPAGAEERVSRVLQYVQDNIRYTSISIDRGAYKPSDPEVVLERRFGDCKDKALLMSTILRRYGIDASPALVNTYRGRTLALGLPSGSVFDHAIVRVRTAGGEYWLDPTLYRQQTPVGTLSPPDYQQALVLAPDTTDLAAIPRPSPASARADIRVEFDVRNGEHQPATMKVEIVYYDNRADMMRASFGAQSLDAWQVGVMRYLERYYPGLRVRGAPELKDDPAHGVLTVTASFEMDKAFHPTGKRWEMAVHTEWLYPFLQPLRLMSRTMPLALGYPAQVRQHTIVLVPSPWSVETGDLKVENPAFTYNSGESYDNYRIELVREFIAQGDTVALEDLARFREDLRKVDKDSPYYLWTTTGPVDAAQLASPDALRLLILDTDVLARKKGNSSHVADKMAAVIAAPAFASLDSELRHKAYALDADMAFALSHWDRAYRSIRAATELPHANAGDWEYRARGAYNTDNHADAAQALGTVARRWPGHLENMSRRTIQDILDEVVDQPDAWFELADALSRTPWAREGAHTFGSTWRELAAALVRKGDGARAREVIGLIDDPHELIQVRADRQFDAVLADPAAAADVSKAAASRLKRLEAASRREPRTLAIIVRRLILLLEVRDYAEVLEVSDQVLRRVAKAKPDAAPFDDPSQVRWVRDYRARALWALDRRDEAVEEWRAAIPADDRTKAVGQAMNLGIAYCNLGRPQDALSVIDAIEVRNTSTQMGLIEVRLCASLALKDANAADAALAFLRDNRAHEPRLYQRALVWSNQLDEAAACLRDRLTDPKTRGEALVDVQDYPPVTVFSRSPEFSARWQQVLQREDVKSAIARVGTVERYPVAPPLE